MEAITRRSTSIAVEMLPLLVGIFLLGSVVYLDAQPTPLPIVPPIPIPVLGLAVESCDADKIVLTAPVADCPRVLTSTKGSTKTMHVRTLTCVKA